MGGSTSSGGMFSNLPAPILPRHPTCLDIHPAPMQSQTTVCREDGLPSVASSPTIYISSLLKKENANPRFGTDYHQEDPISVGGPMDGPTLMNQLSLSRQGTLEGLSEYFIDLSRISVSETSQFSTSQGSFGDVKRGSLAPDNQRDTCEDRSKLTAIAIKFLRIAENIHASDVRRVRPLSTVPPACFPHFHFIFHAEAQA